MNGLVTSRYEVIVTPHAWPAMHVPAAQVIPAPHVVPSGRRLHPEALTHAWQLAQALPGSNAPAANDCPPMVHSAVAQLVEPLELLDVPDSRPPSTLNAELDPDVVLDSTVDDEPPPDPASEPEDDDCEIEPLLDPLPLVECEVRLVAPVSVTCVASKPASLPPE